MIEFCLKSFLYNLFYYLNYPKLLPLSYTIAVTHNCNCKCLTCGVYKNESSNQEELTHKEYEQIFSNLGYAPYWVTFTGGEPFLRKDIGRIIKSLYKLSKPKIITIPTNGILTDFVVGVMNDLVVNCPKSLFVLNISIDDIGQRHDYLRGFSGCYEKLSDTCKKLKKIRRKNFILGVNTVISKYNIERFVGIHKEIIRMQPDSYITEVAQERAELNNMGLKLSPDYYDYSKIVKYLKQHSSVSKKIPSRLIWNIRLKYYDMIENILKNNFCNMKCFAGINSCYISPYGKIYFCATNGSCVGHLRDNKYKLKTIWFSKTAARHRHDLKQRKCFCMLANIFYTNFIYNLKLL